LVAFFGTHSEEEQVRFFSSGISLIYIFRNFSLLKFFFKTLRVLSSLRSLA